MTKGQKTRIQKASDMVHDVGQIEYIKWNTSNVQNIPSFKGPLGKNTCACVCVHMQSHILNQKNKLKFQVLPILKIIIQ